MGLSQIKLFVEILICDSLIFWFENCFSFHKTARLLVENTIQKLTSNQLSYEKTSLFFYFFNFLFFFYESVISSTKTR